MNILKKKKNEKENSRNAMERCDWLTEIKTTIMTQKIYITPDSIEHLNQKVVPCM